MVSATVEDGNANIVRVVFNEPVTIDKDKFYVKVNDLPYKTMAAAPPASGILLDLQKRDDRTITGVSAVPGMNDTAWDMPMTAPAVHGEILRLATTEEGAAQDKAPSPNSLPTIPQFIVSNNVKRVKGSFESIAGLYVNETKIDSVTDGGGGLMYQNALDYLHSTATLPKGNDTIVIVLDTNQTFTRTAAWWTYNQIAENTSNQQPIKIIVTTTGGSVIISNQQSDRAMFEGRNGIILVIDEGVIFEGSSSYPTKGSLIQMMTGGSIILDGGEIRGHVSAKDGGTGSEQNDIHAGAIRFGGGANGGYLIINSGKITGNTAKFNPGGTSSEGNGGAGAVIILQYGVVVMNGGEISGNTLDVQDGTALTAMAGAIMGNINTAQRSGNASFFMTGGEISGNKVVNGTTAVASSGGIVVSGTFQKTGGTIYGADTGNSSKKNTTTLTGNKASAVFVANGSYSTNPPGFKREDTAAPDVTLFVESFKSSASAAATNTVPDWATSFWDE
jgi:hypothetical protein